VTIRDGFIDVELYEGLRYEIDDIDEFTEAMASGELTTGEALQVLRSLDIVSRALRENGFSGQALVRAWAPDLPQ